MNSVFDKFITGASPEQNAQTTTAIDKNGGNENDATIDLESESDYENNVETKNTKDERDGPPKIENTITSNDIIQVDNPEPAIQKIGQRQGMD